MDTKKLLDLEQALFDLGDDREIYKAVLQTYLETTPGLLNDMLDAAQKGDAEKAMRTAHSLKSSSRTIGAMSTGEMAQALEQQFKNEDFSTYRERIQNLKSELELVREVLAESGF